MAKGKEALQAERRRVEELHKIVDRLNSDLAEAKLRARQVEQRAALADRLEVEVSRLRNEQDNDVLLAAALEAIQNWQQIAREDHERRIAGLLDVRKVLDDLNAPLEYVDRLEFVHRRYPNLIAALTAGESKRYSQVWRKDLPARLSEEAVIRIQRLRGQRATLPGVPGERVAADVVGEILDAGQIGFEKNEILQLLDMKASA